MGAREKSAGARLRTKPSGIAQSDVFDPIFLTILLTAEMTRHLAPAMAES
jgi:hypothetical protein